jgi:phosphinothricin acetyltransferase
MSTVLSIKLMTPSHWPSIRKIFIEGIIDGNATFETQPAESYEVFMNGKFENCCIVAIESLVLKDEKESPISSSTEIPSEKVLGWATLARYSSRACYSGVAEVSIYVAKESRGRGIGETLLKSLIELSELNNIWMLQSGIFVENITSIYIHEKNGFRIVGRREKMGKMPNIGDNAGLWRDVLLLERRSGIIGI